MKIATGCDIPALIVFAPPGSGLQEELGAGGALPLSSTSAATTHGMSVAGGFVNPNPSFPSPPRSGSGLAGGPGWSAAGPVLCQQLCDHAMLAAGCANCRCDYATLNQCNSFAVQACCLYADPVNAWHLCYPGLQCRVRRCGLHDQWPRHDGTEGPLHAG
jgi:hypothetical protein